MGNLTHLCFSEVERAQIVTYFIVHGYKLVENATVELMKRCFSLGQGPLIYLYHAYTWRLQRTGTNETFLCPISQHNFTILTQPNTFLSYDFYIFTGEFSFQFIRINLN